jgi:hypothetical protein
VVALPLVYRGLLAQIRTSIGQHGQLGALLG